MLEVGERLSGRYKIERTLGKGGMGAVYLASQESLGGKKVAVKEMVLQDSRATESAVEQFRREATFLAHLDHPNLVKVTDFFSEGDKHYLVMDYVEGETLQSALERRQKPYSWQELKPYARSLVKVLHYLHTREPAILFRDLKPANIMIDRKGRLKLIDFGIARVAAPGMETHTFIRGTGTNGFSPIEQYGNGETTDQRADIYAFGATLYYLMTGKIPPNAVARASVGQTLEPASTYNPELPTGMDAILSRCLEVRRDMRYATIRDVAKNLGRLGVPGANLESLTIVPDGQVRLENSPGEIRQSAPWAAALAVLGVACAATASFFIVNVSRGFHSEDAGQAQVVERPAVSTSSRPAYSGTVSQPAAGRSAQPVYFSVPTPAASEVPVTVVKREVTTRRPAPKSRSVVANEEEKNEKRAQFSLGTPDYPTYRKKPEPNKNLRSELPYTATRLRPLPGRQNRRYFYSGG